MNRSVALTVLATCLVAGSACANADEGERAAEVALAQSQLEGQPGPAPATQMAATNGQASDPATGPTITVFKTPSCGCCSLWAEHMQEAGFVVDLQDAQSLDDVKRQAGVPADLASCHTAIVDGLVVEGHVPASTVKEVLANRNGLRGIAVPGMPMGSPGMEIPGQAADAYDVIGFTEDGTRTVVAKH